MHPDLKVDVLDGCIYLQGYTVASSSEWRIMEAVQAILQGRRAGDELPAREKHVKVNSGAWVDHPAFWFRFRSPATRGLTKARRATLAKRRLAES